MLAPAPPVAPPSAVASAVAVPALTRKGPTRVVSVDGPGRLTVTALGGRRRVAIRLIGVDTPEPGQCGADESRAALRQVVAKTRSRRLLLALPRKVSGRYPEDADGRLLARVIYRHKAEVSGIADRLLTSGWARLGTAVRLGDPAPPSSGVYFAGHDPTLPGRAPVGLWTACGGYAHAAAPTGAPAAAPTWTITPDGVTTAIGPLTLPAPPALTFAALAARFPLELRRDGARCLAAVPSLQLELYPAAPEASACGPQRVGLIVSRGPGTAVTDRGLQVLSDAAALAPFFPLVDPATLARGSRSARLAGSGRSSAWQTVAVLNANARVQAFATFALPPSDDDL